MYVLAVLLAGLSGLVVASGAAGGLSGQLGFGLLSVLWLVVTALGVWHARARRFAAGNDVTAVIVEEGVARAGAQIC